MLGCLQWKEKEILLTCFAIDNIVRVVVILRIVVIIVLSNVTVVVFFHHVHVAEKT